MEDHYGQMHKRGRFGEELYGSEESSIQGIISPANINSQLASVFIKPEHNSPNEEEEMPTVQEFQFPSQNFSLNVLQLLQKEACELTDVDLHVLITRCKDRPVVFKRMRDDAYDSLFFHAGGLEPEAEPTNYVECRLCAKVFTKSGGHLKRHRSRHYPDMETPIPANLTFEQPPIQPTPPPVFSAVEMPRNLTQRSPNLPLLNSQEFIRPQDRENLARALTQFCIQEGLAPGIIQRHTFVDLVNVLLNFGSRTPPIMATTVLPPVELITACIYRRFNWLCNEKVPRMQTDLLVYNGAFVVGSLLDAPKLTALSIHYFDQKWTLKKAVVGLAPALDPTLTWNHCLDSVVAVNMQKQTLNQLICVSGAGTAAWGNHVTLENRHTLCSCDLLEHIVEEAFDSKIEELESNEGTLVNDIFKAANSIMQFAKLQVFSPVIKVPPDTVYKWLKILRVVEFAFEELNQLRSVSSKPEVQSTLPENFFDCLQILETNRDFLSELINFLKIFRAAIVELQAIEEPTLPLVWPAVMTVKYDLLSLIDSTNFPALKNLASRALHLIKLNFDVLVKDEHKTATFLNPKQRKLQHLMELKEYEEFKENMRKRLAIERPQIERKIEDRRRFYQDDEEEEIGDEIERYLNSKRSGNEKIVDFWKRHETLLPKLSAEARRLLATPASTNYVCGNLSHYAAKITEFSVDAIAKLIITRSLELI